MREPGFGPFGMPLVVWRCRRMLLILLTVGPLVSLIPTWPSDGAGLVAVPLITAACVFLLMRSNRTFRRRAHEHRYEICLGCGYLLVGSCPEGRCPECGIVYSKPQIARVWRDWLGD